VRREGVDPQRDAPLVRRIAETVVRDHDERSLTGAVLPVPALSRSSASWSPGSAPSGRDRSSTTRPSRRSGSMHLTGSSWRASPSRAHQYGAHRRPGRRAG
jgi:hypothetical protein